MTEICKHILGGKNDISPRSVTSWHFLISAKFDGMQSYQWAGLQGTSLIEHPPHPPAHWLQTMGVHLASGAGSAPCRPRGHHDDVRRLSPRLQPRPW